MANTTKPSVIIVHGAWHVPEHYSLLTKGLESAGYKTHCPLLPTCASPSTSTFTDDVTSIRTLVTTLADQGESIIMVFHSYGGTVGSEAMPGLSTTERQKEGKSGGVMHLMYMTAFMLQVGSTLGQASLPRPDPEPIQVFPDGLTFPQVDPIEIFYHDVQDKDLQSKAVSLLVKHRGDAAFHEAAYPAWKYIPTVYIECTTDQILFPHWQRQQIDAVRATGTEIDVWTYDSAHSPFLSIPQQMVQAVERITALH